MDAKNTKIHAGVRGREAVHRDGTVDGELRGLRFVRSPERRISVIVCEKLH